MSLNHVDNGDRAYLDDKQQYGDIDRKGFLGIEKSVILQCDDGTRKAYCGESATTHVVHKETQVNGDGDHVDVPTDVKEIGPSILAAMGIAEVDQGVFFQKFMVLAPELRQEKIQYWVQNKSDPVKMESFFSELITLLQSDDLFVSTQANTLLNHLHADTRTTMAQSLFSTTTALERKDLILLFTANKTNKTKTKAFLQDMYERFLDDDTYLKMEFKRALVGVHIFEPKASEIINKFFEDSSEETIAETLGYWRTNNLYKSKIAPKYTHRLLRKYL